MAKRVLITGARSAAALDLARDFAAAGWQPHLADSVKSRLARWSSLDAKHHAYPPPRQDGAAFRKRIAQLVIDHEIDLLVPTCEEVFHLASPILHDELDQRLFAPNLAKLKMLHDKFAFARATKNWGLPVSESHLIETERDLEAFKPSSRDWVFKPCFSRFGDATLIAPNPSALNGIKPEPNAQWIAQQYVRGKEACFHAVAYRGKLVAFAAYMSDWRLPGGACYAFEPLDVKWHDRLRDIAEKLSHSAGLHGQFGCDVIFDARGEPHLIECNPRATSGVHLLAGEGHLAKAIAEGVPAPNQRATPAFLAPAMLAFGLPKAITTGRLGNWKNCLSNGRDAISSAGDPLPFIGAIADTTCFALKGLRHKISINAATTHDIEWNGEELEQ